MRALSLFLIPYSLFLFSSTNAFSETPDQILSELKNSNTSRGSEILRQILTWETGILGQHTYPNNAQRAEYLSILFSDPVISSPQLTNIVSNELSQRVRDRNWRGSIRNLFLNASTNAVQLQAVAPLHTYIEGASLVFGGKTLNQRLTTIYEALQRARLRPEQIESAIVRGLIPRIHATGPSHYENFLGELDFEVFPQNLRLALDRYLRAPTGSSPRPTGVPTRIPDPSPRVGSNSGPNLNSPAPTTDLLIGNTATSERTSPGEIHLPGTATPAETSSQSPVSNNLSGLSADPAQSNSVASPATQTSVEPGRGRASQTQDIQDWIDLLRQLQELERRIDSESVAATRERLITQADELFKRGVRLANPILAALEQSQQPPVDFSRLREARNEFFDSHLDALRHEILLPYLYGHAPRNIQEEPSWNTPRASALAAAALSAVVFRRRAPRGGSHIAQSISTALQNYQNEERANGIPRDTRSAMERLFQRSEQIYRRSANELVIGPTRSSNIFQANTHDEQALQRLNTALLDSAVYGPVLSKLAESRSMESTLALINKLREVETLIDQNPEGTQRQQLIPYADALLEAIQTLGERGQLAVTGARHHFSANGSAREIFRRRLYSQFNDEHISPRVVSALIYGLAGSALFNQASARQYNLEQEREHGYSVINSLPDTLRNHSQVQGAISAFRNSHEWVVPPRPIPSGPYRPVDPFAEAEPAQPSAGNANNANSRPRGFLSAHWWERAFLKTITDPATKKLFEAMAQLRVGSGASSNQRRQALDRLREAHITDLSVLLALADTLRESRVRAYDGHEGTTPPDRNTIQRALISVLNRWSREYRAARREETPPDPNDPKTQLLARLLGVAPTALADLEQEASDRLTRIFRSGDPPLMEAASRVLASLEPRAVNSENRPQTLSQLRGILLDANSSDHFSPRALGVLQRLYDRLGGPSLSVSNASNTTSSPPEQSAPPAPEVTTVFPTRQSAPTQSSSSPTAERMTPDQILHSLEVLSQSDPRFTAQVRDAIWEELLLNSMEQGIREPRVLSALLDWVQRQEGNSEGKGKALRLLLHSWDHLPQIYESMPELVDRVHDTIEQQLRESRRGPSDPTFDAVMSGFQNLTRRRTPLPVVVENVANALNCSITMEFLTRPGHRLGTVPASP